MLCSTKLCHHPKNKAVVPHSRMAMCQQMGSYLHHASPIAHVDQNFVTRRLPGQDTSDHGRIHAVLLADGLHRGLMFQEVWHV